MDDRVPDPGLALRRCTTATATADARRTTTRIAFDGRFTLRRHEQASCHAAWLLLLDKNDVLPGSLSRVFAIHRGKSRCLFRCGDKLPFDRGAMLGIMETGMFDELGDAASFQKLDGIFKS